MIITSWNTRSFNMPQKQKGVRAFVEKHKIDVFCLLETRIRNQKKMEMTLNNNFLCWDSCNNLCVNPAGRMALLWNVNKVELDVLDTPSRHIHCKVKCKITQIQFFVSFAYGLYSTVHRRKLWDSLEKFGCNLLAPWMILGDFNCFLQLDDKLGGKDPSPSDIRDFTKCCQSLGLVDLQYTGCRYTWTNNSIDNSMWIKLDRALGNSEWLQENTNTLVTFLTSGCLSDHSPCMVTVSPT